jgi:hypothetical protein
MEIVKCPYCGSTNILYWVEEVRTVYYKTKKNGDPYKIPIRKGTHDLLDTCGYVCDDCKHMGYMGDMSSDEFLVKKENNK